jgi:hypothetical protein
MERSQMILPGGIKWIMAPDVPLGSKYDTKPGTKNNDTIYQWVK